MKKFEFLIVSPSERVDFDVVAARAHQDVNVTAMLNNKEPLAKIYNTFLRDARSAVQKPEFVIFMHHDVQLNVSSFINHLDEVKGKYDVIGLCGTEELNVSQSPLNWFTGSRFVPNKRWGCVTHGEVANSTSFYSSDRADVTDHQVACIDGLCMTFGKKALDSKLEFDESFMFDQYDTDISLQTILTYHMKLGVIVERSLQHFSIGKSILGTSFIEHEKDLRKKWNIELSSAAVQ